MELEKNIDNIKDDFLTNIKDLPGWAELYKLNHWSPSQVTKMNCMWGYEYLYLTQEQRRALPINSKCFLVFVLEI